VRQPRGQRVDAVDLRANAAGGRPRLAREHHGEAPAAGVLEAVEVAVHDLRAGAGDVEAARGQVLGLPGREGSGRDEQQEPGSDHEPAPPFEKAPQPVHSPLHAFLRLAIWPASQDLPGVAGGLM
jgi:hypothetical protein